MNFVPNRYEPKTKREKTIYYGIIVVAEIAVATLFIAAILSTIW